MAKEKRSKLGYLSREEIQDRVDKGLLDAYDYSFAYDTKEWLMITPDLKVEPVRSRIDTYESEEDAVRGINNDTSTYAGQIIAINQEGMYSAYSVNYNPDLKRYFISPISAGQIDLNYNNLSNVPITNIVANASDDLILSNLNDGYYSVVGTFKLSNLDPTTHIETSPLLYAIKHVDDTTYIRELGAHAFKSYVVGNDSIKEDEFATKSWVEEEIDTKTDESIASAQEIQDLFKV